MKILFKTNFSSEKIEIDLKSTDNGANIREKLAEKLNVKADELKVNYWGDVIQDDITVEFYKMKEGDEIGYEVAKKTLKQTKSAQPDSIEKVSDSINIKLKAKDQVLEIEVYPEDTIAIVRKKIADKFSYPFDGIMIKFNNFPLFPGRKVEECGIKSDSQLDLFIDEKMLANAIEAKKKEEEKKADAKEVPVKVKFSGEDSFEVSISEAATVKDLIAKIKSEKKLTEDIEVVIEKKLASHDEKLDLYELKKITVFVKRANEKYFFLKRAAGGVPILVIIDANATIDQVKDFVDKQEKMAKASQSIKHNKDDLKGDVKLSDLNIEDGGSLEFVFVQKSLFMNKK